MIKQLQDSIFKPIVKIETPDRDSRIPHTAPEKLKQDELQIINKGKTDLYLTLCN